MPNATASESIEFNDFNAHTVQEAVALFKKNAAIIDKARQDYCPHVRSFAEIMKDIEALSIPLGMLTRFVSGDMLPEEAMVGARIAGELRDSQNTHAFETELFAAIEKFQNAMDDIVKIKLDIRQKEALARNRFDTRQKLGLPPDPRTNAYMESSETLAVMQQKATDTNRAAAESVLKSSAYTNLSLGVIDNWQTGDKTSIGLDHSPDSHDTPGVMINQMSADRVVSRLLAKAREKIRARDTGASNVRPSLP